MTTEAAVKSRDSERHPTATPAIIPGVQHVARSVKEFKQFESIYKMNNFKLMQ